ncbi:sensor histidine kinase [Micrococcus luteus]|uniref:sensor histidine kinase n=1 Tax=Micrococcus luteus TaxID=1270 RepID=UPI001642728E|nr:HAMP domain-containing sensor histidine kinase [Micrococcus luteus]
MLTLLLAALTLLGVTSVLVLRQNLLGQAENALYLSSESIVAQLVSELQVSGHLPESPDSAPLPPADGFYVVFKDGRPVFSMFVGPNYSDRSLTGLEISGLQEERRRTADGGALTVPGVGEYLVMDTELAHDSPEPWVVVSGVGLGDINRIVGTYVLWLVVVGVAIGAITVLVGTRVVNAALRPLARVAAVADRMSQTPLSSGEIGRQERAPRDAHHTGSETDRVAEALNRLLSHIEFSFNARERTEESMRRFVAEASHELRNPLSSIRGYADFYGDSDGSRAEMRNALNRISAEATRMSELVDNLLLLAKLDADPEVKREDIELSRIVAETVADARFAYPSHTWRMALPVESATVQGDEDATRRILLNLVANAGHHTPPGTEVTVAVVYDEGGSALVVTDNGPGIPASAIPTLFDRFTQARVGSSTSTRERTTVGLGLAIVHALATASEYTISVDSGSWGTRFTLQIPSGPAASPPAGRARP